MKFFKPEDFDCLRNLSKGDVTYIAARRANNKLEYEGKVVEVELGYVGQIFNSNLFRSETKARALLINIEEMEPIEQCKHPKEKVKRHIEYQPTVKGLPTTFRESFDCECGAVVTPNTFEEV